MSKVGVSEMFDEYKKSNIESRKALNGEILGYKNTQNYLLEKLVPYKHYIDNFTNIEYESIAKLSKPIPYKNIQSITGIGGLDLDTLRRTVNGIVEINSELNKSETSLAKFEKCDISKDIFKEVIYRFNTKVSDEILYKGYTFRPGFGLSSTRIKKIKTDLRIRKRINWDESLKYKAQLIAEGKLPFKVLEWDSERRPIKDNGGEKWFVYFEGDFDYLWNWNKKKANALNTPYYKFRPTIYNNTKKGGKLGNINKLKQLVKIDSELLKNYSE